MIIISDIPGRLRVRDRQLAEGARAGTIEEQVQAVAGVTGVTVNPRTGSLLVVYTPAAAVVAEIRALLAGLFGPAEASGAAGPCLRPLAGLLATATPLHRNSVKLGMIVSLLTSLIGVALGAEAVHIAAGVLFLATLAVHLFERRRLILIRG